MLELDALARSNDKLSRENDLFIRERTDNQTLLKAYLYDGK